ncbi:MAG: TRAP transporter fused permease subunit [Clostridia bacterium]|jgi:TRAP transporter 4TM/12TM fusion protein|nr:TRAP transporter fused permease subunit [Clostridia bacterium]
MVPETAATNVTPKASPASWIKNSIFWKVSVIVALAMAAFHFYTSCFGVLEAWRHRSVHMIFILLLAYLSYGKITKFRLAEKVITLTLVIVCSAYVLIGFPDIYLREGIPTTGDIIIGTILTFLIIEAARRYVGAPMAIIALLFFAYALFGHYLPGRLASPDFSYGKIMAQIFNSNYGIFGSVTGVAATNVVMFIFLGSFLQESGGSDFFSDFSIMATKNITGGPAKAAVIASCLVGTIQGNAISNVATTGAFTIPLMKRAGYSPVFAGAVEAAASTGGMIMPPVMGAAAFLLAELTGTPYKQIILYSIVPAILYYLGVYMAIHLRALKLNLKPVLQETSLNRKELFWQGLTCISPFIVLITFLIKGYSAMFSATAAIGILVLIWIIRPVKRMTLMDLKKALENGSRGMLSVSSACIAAGVIVGLISITGLGIKVSVIVGLSQSNIWMVLFLSMIVCIILGMGLPVSASYVLAAVTVGPVLIKSGLPMVPAHLFLMYFATMSAITPPVALASYTAAGLSGASPNDTGWQALLLALPAFLVPFIFIFSPELLLIGEGMDIVLAIISATIGIIALSFVTEGWMFGKIPVYYRALLCVTVISCLMVGLKSDLLGYAILLFVGIQNYLKYKKNQNNAIIGS